MHLFTVTQCPFWLHFTWMQVKNCSYHIRYENWGAVEKISVYNIVNNWCEPHIVNSPPPLPHPDRGHSAAKIKQIYIVLLIHQKGSRPRALLSHPQWMAALPAHSRHQAQEYELGTTLTQLCGFWSKTRSCPAKKAEQPKCSCHCALRYLYCLCFQVKIFFLGYYEN